MSRPISVSNSILGRRRELGDAIWTWLWMVDHATQVGPMSDGNLEGLVSNGDKVEAGTIAKDLELSVTAVNKHIAVLCKAGFVRKKGSAALASVTEGAR
jgi:hypothetical protein